VNALISPKSAFMHLGKAAEKVISELRRDKFEQTLFSQRSAFDGYIISSF
jgi:hypothetical protein